MDRRSLGWLFVVGLVAVVGWSAARAEERTWSDANGKFSVSAEFVGVRGDKVVLRRADGKEVTVALERLSAADREFVKSQTDAAGSTASEAEKPAKESAAAATASPDALAEIASLFFADLRSKDRNVARDTLTKKAQSLIKDGNSPLTALPKPEAGDKSIKIGKPALDGQVAEIPVMVRAGNKVHRTKLHLRCEGDTWQVFALSAMYPDGEKSINFEAEAAAAAEVDPLMALVGKPVEVAGMTLEGEPVNSTEYKGKVVLVDFWATWCGPCRAEMPNIAANYEKYHDAGFEVLAVSVDEDLDALRTFTAAEKPPWTVVADNHPKNKNSMGAKFQIRAIPAVILIGQDGKVAAVHVRGPQLGKQLERLLAGGRAQGSARSSSVTVRTLR